jgi:asparagine synthetase B (glutamine-hydrolysing)
MCGLFFSNTQRPFSEEKVRTFCAQIARRGPDASKIILARSRSGRYLSFGHFLLDISGMSIVQPMSWASGASSGLFLFNGEIYNHEDLSLKKCSDSEALRASIERAGDLSVDKLDGEFAILLWNADAETLVVAVDPFRTKPLFLGRGPSPSDFGVASYESALTLAGFQDITCIQPNSNIKIKSNGSSVSIQEFHPSGVVFSCLQTVNSYDRWIETFIEAVKKRATHGKGIPLVCLSSGYDSGAIALALNLLNIPYRTISILGGENEALIKQRISMNSAACREGIVIEGLSSNTQSRIGKELSESVEALHYFSSDNISLASDGGAIGMFAIGEIARKLGTKFCISGSGADEIISDYGYNGQKYTSNSSFGGKFPSDLAPIFPWPNFYGRTQRDYLFKEEIVLGFHGIEGRYPFLDSACVQAFLELSVSLKNKEYKAPIAHFLRANGYPFEENKKRGFSPQAPKLRHRLKKLFQ